MQDDDLQAISAAQFYADAVSFYRGDALSETIEAYPDNDPDPQFAGTIAGSAALRSFAANDAATGRERMAEAVASFHRISEFDDDFPSAWAMLLEMGDDAPVARSWLDTVAHAPRGKVTGLLRALLPYFQARFAVDASPTAVEVLYVEAIDSLRSFGLPLWVGLASMRYADWLITQGRGELATPLLDDAEQVLTALHATPWVDKVRRARAFAIR